MIGAAYYGNVVNGICTATAWWAISIEFRLCDGRLRFPGRSSGWGTTETFAVISCVEICQTVLLMEAVWMVTFPAKPADVSHVEDKRTSNSD